MAEAEGGSGSSVYAAARVGDSLAHSSRDGSKGFWHGLGGFLLGAVIAAAAIILVAGVGVFTGGVGIVALCAWGAVATGGISMGISNALSATKGTHGKPDPPCGVIIGDGSPNVTIEGMPAARAGIDKEKHDGKLLAFGAEHVYVNGKLLARVGDKGQCGGLISKACENTKVGGKSTQVVDDVESSDTLWGYSVSDLDKWGTRAGYLNQLLMIPFIGFFKVAGSFVGAIAGKHLGGWVGGWAGIGLAKVLGKNAKEQKEYRDSGIAWGSGIGSFTGGMVGGKLSEGAGNGMFAKGIPGLTKGFPSFLKGANKAAEAAEAEEGGAAAEAGEGAANAESALAKAAEGEAQAAAEAAPPAGTKCVSCSGGEEPAPAAAEPEVMGPPKPATPEPEVMGPPKPGAPEPEVMGPPKPGTPEPEFIGPPKPPAPEPEVMGPPKPPTADPEVAGPPKPATPPEEPAGTKPDEDAAPADEDEAPGSKGGGAPKEKPNLLKRVSHFWEDRVEGTFGRAGEKFGQWLRTKMPGAEREEGPLKGGATSGAGFTDFVGRAWKKTTAFCISCAKGSEEEEEEISNMRALWSLPLKELPEKINTGQEWLESVLEDEEKKAVKAEVKVVNKEITGVAAEQKEINDKAKEYGEQTEEYNKKAEGGGEGGGEAGGGEAGGEAKHPPTGEGGHE